MEYAEPTVTQRARLNEIELTEVVAFAPDARVYCKTLGLWTRGGRVETCANHYAQDSDCRYCWESGTVHEPCAGCL